jgi:hypothetical protein
MPYKLSLSTNLICYSSVDTEHVRVGVMALDSSSGGVRFESQTGYRRTKALYQQQNTCSVGHSAWRCAGEGHDIPRGENTKRTETHDPPCTRFEPHTSQNSSGVATAISKADKPNDQHNALSRDRKKLQQVLFHPSYWSLSICLSHYPSIYVTNSIELGPS